MPAFGPDKASEEDLIKVIAYIKSLKKGETPVRTEDWVAPVGAPTSTFFPAATASMAWTWKSDSVNPRQTRGVRPAGRGGLGGGGGALASKAARPDSLRLGCSP